jgi:TRAP-type mannitol/chloroaromatic compound transport system substrate-binding protein
MRGILLGSALAVGLAAVAGVVAAQAPPGQTPMGQAASRVLRMQAAWPAHQSQFENFQMFARRVDTLTAGRLKIDTLPAGRVSPPAGVLDAVSRRAVDGGHAWAGYWQSKNKAAILFTGGPGGPWGMDHLDFLSWMWWGGGLELYNRFYRDVLKVNVVAFPISPASPQALGWFKREVRSLADLRGMKCRQTGIAAEIFAEMGMKVVNIPGEEIAPAAKRGMIDCAEWIGGVEDLRFGMHAIWKLHYAPSLHESVSIGELLINGDVWNELGPHTQEIVKAAATETMLMWWAKWQRQNAEALEELRTKHKVQLRETPPEVHLEFLKAWDRVAAREAERNPFFKEVYEAQRQWASITVPAKRFYFPPHAIAADHYWGDRRR